MIERVQYNTALAITGAIKGTSQLKIYKELGLESLKFGRWFRCLCLFFENCIYNTHNQDQIDTYYCRTDLFKYSFFHICAIVECNKLDITLRDAQLLLIFKNSLLKIGRPIQNSIFKIHDLLGIKFLRRLRLGLSHLNEHRFRHNF